MKSKKEGGRREIRKVKRVREEIWKKSGVGVEGEKPERVWPLICAAVPGWVFLLPLEGFA